MYQDTYDETRNAFINRQQAIADNAWTQRSRNANVQAGNMLANGNATGAQNALFNAGDIAGGQQVQQYSDTQRVQHAQAAQRISQGIRAAVNAGHTPAEAYDMATQIAPQLGVDPADLQKMRPAFDKDPRAFLDMVDQQAAKELKINNVEGVGIVATNPVTGKSTLSYGAPAKPIALDPDKNYIVPDNGSTAGPAAQPGSAQPIPTARPDADAVFNAIIQQESSGRPGVTGPKTPYGQAQGIGQLLPKTAQAMAQKLGVVWRPDLMTGTSPEAQQYQTQLSRAYFDQAWQASGGDPAQAAKYYYGGPDQKIWGPKTQAYSQAIVGRLGSGGLQGGAGGDQLQAAPAGYRYIQRAQAGGEDSGLSQDAVDMNAMRYAMTGQLPPTGMGKQAAADKRAIISRAAEITKQYNIKPEDWVTGMAQFKVTQGSLAQISKTQAMVTAAENTVVANADLALSLAPKGGGPTGSPVFNRWIQAGRKSVAGDPDVAKFDAALGTVADEYAKVMTSNTGTGGQATTDSARNEAYHRLNSAMNLQQLQGVIGIMKQEMSNRTASLQAQQSALTDQLRHGVVGQGATPGQQGAPQPAARTDQPKIRRYNPATGRLE